MPRIVSKAPPMILPTCHKVCRWVGFGPVIRNRVFRPAPEETVSPISFICGAAHWT